MKKSQIEVGKRYAAKVGGREVTVRIDSESPYGGWNATTCMTGRKVWIGTANQLRFEVGAEHHGR